MTKSESSMVTRDTPYQRRPRCSGKKEIIGYYLWFAICSVWWVAIDTYQEVVMEMHFVLLSLRMYMCLIPDG